MPIRPLAVRVAVVGLCLAGAIAPAVAQPLLQSFQSYVTGLSGPIGAMHAGDGSGRLFVIQQGGAVRVLRNGTLLATPLLTLSNSGPDLVTCTYPGAGAPVTVGFTGGGERGLLGLAFQPNFETNGRVFVSITDQNGDSMLLRYAMASPAADVMSPADKATCTVVLRVDQDFGNHNGGNIAFGPDGNLYFGLGDGGSGGDPCNRAQTLAPANLSGSPSGGVGDDCAADNTFLNTPASANGDPDSRALQGKMLRLNVDAVTASPGTALCGEPRVGQEAAYAIPIGQPGAAGGSIASACDEVWAYGLRNPWRWSFDRQTGDMLIGDVGQGAVEEVDFEAAGAGGANYGWRCIEGNSNTGTCPPPAGAIAPIVTYTHSAGRCSITGGYRYRGPLYGIQGHYYYADYCTGEVWKSINNGGSWTQPGAPLQDLGNIPSFGEGEDGTLYLLNGSQLWRLNGPDLFYDSLEDPAS